LQNTHSNTTLIRSLSEELGFDFCGIAKAVKLDDDARRLENWLSKGMQGSMKYMENYFDLRVDPCKLVPGAKSVITLLLNYYPENTVSGDYKISKYAYGKDYHEVIRKKLNEYLFRIREKVGQVNGRGFVDSAPVLERSWAQRSGAGWIGKNGNLITRTGGSYFFIATLITDLELDYDDMFARDYCGSCRRCIDACPTDAIQEDKIVDGSRCISYYTIELKEMLIPAEMKGRFDSWMFGCDVCQDVCPWNRFSSPTKEIAFSPLPAVLNMSTLEWDDMTEEMFRELFRGSPLKRARLEGIKRNISFLKTK
jgi:epoxyqueuosine reductase